MRNPGILIAEKASAFKHAFSSRQAMVKYLEAPLLEGDEDSLENRRVRLEPDHGRLTLRILTNVRPAVDES